MTTAVSVPSALPSSRVLSIEFLHFPLSPHREGTNFSLISEFIIKKIKFKLQILNFQLSNFDLRFWIVLAASIAFALISNPLIDLVKLFLPLAEKDHGSLFSMSNKRNPVKTRRTQLKKKKKNMQSKINLWIQQLQVLIYQKKIRRKISRSDFSIIFQSIKNLKILIL